MHIFIYLPQYYLLLIYSKHLITIPAIIPHTEHIYYQFYTHILCIYTQHSYILLKIYYWMYDWSTSHILTPSVFSNILYISDCT